MNVWTFSGNLGRDPQPGNVNGTPVLNFAVGVKSGFGQRQQTVWADCALWGQRAESMASMLHKGKYVVVTGELGEREFTRGDGTPGKAMTVRVTDIDLGPRETGQQNQPPAQQRPPAQQQPPQRQAPTAGRPQTGSFDDFDDEIPF